MHADKSEMQGLHTLPVMATCDPVCAEGVAVLSAPGCSKVIRSGTCSPDLQAGKLSQIQSRLIEKRPQAAQCPIVINMMKFSQITHTKKTVLDFCLKC